MDKISQEDFDAAAAIKPERKEEPEINDKDMRVMLEEMDNPVLAQKKIAVQIKIFLDQQIKKEMRDKGYLSEHTRKWIDSFNSILEKIQKALHGDKSVNLHLHKVSHSDISEKIRESIIVIGEPDKKKKSKKSED